MKDKQEHEMSCFSVCLCMNEWKQTICAQFMCNDYQIDVDIISNIAKQRYNILERSI